jgi:NAD(P)H-flavin reductase
MGIDVCLKPGQVYPEGRMSQYMDKMVLGECLDFKGPKGRFTYQRNAKRAIGANRIVTEQRSRAQAF